MNRKTAIAETAETHDLIARFGITRAEIIGEISRQAVQAIALESGGDLLDRVTISLADASRFLHLTREEIRANAEILDHGKRNQVITLRSFDSLRDSRKVTPSKL